MNEQEFQVLVDSFGGHAVGLTFNPSGDEAVKTVKVQYAEIINSLDLKRQNSVDSEVKRLCSWAVKAITWGAK